MAGLCMVLLYIGSTVLPNRIRRQLKPGDFRSPTRLLALTFLPRPKPRINLTASTFLNFYIVFYHVSYFCDFMCILCVFYVCCHWRNNK